MTSPPLFDIVMDALSLELKIGCPWELFPVNEMKELEARVENEGA